MRVHYYFMTHENKTQYSIFYPGTVYPLKSTLRLKILEVLGYHL